MKWHDISVDLRSDLPVWPGDPHIRLERFQKIEEGADANVSSLAMGLHAGTHVDVPYHFLAQGENLSQIDLTRFLGQASVIEIHSSIDLITEPVLAQLPRDSFIERVLFKTRNSQFWTDPGRKFHKDYVALDAGGAQFLIDAGVRLVGIDYLSIAPFRAGRETHVKLLSAGVLILEGLDLSGVNPGMFELICLPLKLWQTEGAPARAILLER